MESIKPTLTTAETKFDNNFWNEDIGNFQGWEVVIRRLKEGRQILKDYTDFVRQRASIEEQFGKALVKLAKTFVIKEDSKPMNEFWDGVKAQTEASGMAHLTASDRMFSELQKILDLAETFREKRRMKEEAVRVQQHSLKVQWKRTQDAKRIYDIRCKEEVVCNQAYHQEIARSGKSSKEAEKALTKYEKSKQCLDSSEIHYRSAASATEECRRLWESETENSLAAFEALEEERLGVTRNSIWRLANVTSAASVADDEAAESVRQTLETNNLADVFKEFVDNEGTGNKRPKPVEFQQQTTSSSIGMGKADDLDGGEVSLSTQTSSTRKQPVSADSQSLVMPSSASMSPSSSNTMPLPPSTPSLGGIRHHHHHYVVNSPNSMSLSSLNAKFLTSTPTNSVSASGLPLPPGTPRPGTTSSAMSSLARPKKPPRLLQYQQPTYNRPASATLISNTHKMMNNYNNNSVFLKNNAVDNSEYFSLNLFDGSGGCGSVGGVDVDSSGGSGGTPPSTTDYLSDGDTTGLPHSSSHPLMRDTTGDFGSSHPSTPAQHSFPTRTRSSSSSLTSPINPSQKVQRTYDKPQPPLPQSQSYPLEAAGGGVVPPPPGVTRASNACPKAIVVFDHVPPASDSYGQVSLDRSQIVDVVDQTGRDWWKVSDAMGRQGYYPSHYLKII